MNSSKCFLENCKSKLKLYDLSCRCENKYCTKHRLPELHNCSYDFKKEKIHLERIVADKVIKI